MEIVVLISFAWLAMVLGELAYSCMICLARWIPAFAAGAVVGEVAHSFGGSGPHSVAAAVATSLTVRHFWRRRLL
jgi:hypothetical protein